ncbi:hypothetical protein ABFS83_09G057100 [Erythranthe nasuta]
MEPKHELHSHTKDCQIFAFLCGRIGHAENHCLDRYEEGFVDPGEYFPYGIWLRTSNQTVEDIPRSPLKMLNNNNVIRTTPSPRNTRRGVGSFDFATQKENLTIQENYLMETDHHNVLVGDEATLVNHTIRFQESEKSDSSTRRQIKVSSKGRKKKATESGILDRETLGKGKLCTYVTKILAQRRRLQCSPAGINELHIFELSRARGSLDNSCAREYSPGSSALAFVCFRNESNSVTYRKTYKKKRWNLNGIWVEKVGQSGGLALFWQKEAEVDLISYSNNHIDAEVSGGNHNSKWRVTGFYGFPEKERRHMSWDLLRNLRNHCNLPWIVGGRF